MGLKAEISPVENPRQEAEEHYYNPNHTGLLELGLKPHFLTDKVLAAMIEFVAKHKAKIRPDQIYRNQSIRPGLTWIPKNRNYQ